MAAGEELTAWARSKVVSYEMVLIDTIVRVARRGR